MSNYFFFFGNKSKILCNIQIKRDRERVREKERE